MIKGDVHKSSDFHERTLKVNENMLLPLTQEERRDEAGLAKTCLVNIEDSKLDYEFGTVQERLMAHCIITSESFVTILEEKRSVEDVFCKL